MNKEIKLTLLDLYLGYAGVAIVMYTIGGVAYHIGKTKGKIEICERVNELIEKHSL